MPVELARDCLRLDRRLSRAELNRYQALIAERTSWGYYQRLVIEDAAGERLETPGTHLCHSGLATLDRFGFPRDFTGKTVLDIGCNAGFYSFAAKLRGAQSVLGLDHQPHYIEQARVLRELLGVAVDLEVSDGHDLDERLGTFDIVINTGVIYHLQNPMDFLARMGRLTREMMYLESEVLTDSKYADYAWFIEKEYCQDQSNWWIYGPRCVERMVRAAGFSRAEFQGFTWTPPSGIKTPEGFDLQGRGAFVCQKEDRAPGEVEQLQDEARLLEREVPGLEARIAEIEADMGWRALRRLRRWRFAMFPRGSRRERMYVVALGAFLRFIGKLRAGGP